MQREAVAAGAACVSRCWSSVRRSLPELLVQREAVAVGAARDSCRWRNAMLRLLDPLRSVAARGQGCQSSPDVLLGSGPLQEQ
jgi:hypothetical protein